MKRLASVLILGVLLGPACGDDGGQPGGDAGAAGVSPVAGGFGGRLQQGALFTVILFVLGDDGDVIDLVGIACAPDGTLVSNVVTVEEGVAIEGGSFHADSPDVRVDGSFVSPTRAEGTVEALTPNAEGCGIGASSSWTSDCDLSVDRVEPEEPEEGGIVVGGVSGTTDNGTAFAVVEVVAQDGSRLEAELDGACAA